MTYSNSFDVPGAAAGAAAAARQLVPAAASEDTGGRDVGDLLAAISAAAFLTEV